MDKGGYVYILTNPRHTVLYTGVTSDLARRIEQHRASDRSTFAGKYNTRILVHVEEYPEILQAIDREKQIKAGSRKKKLALIQEFNPDWNDLADDLW